MEGDIEDLLCGLPIELARRLIERYKKATLAYWYRNWSNLFSESSCFSEIVFRLAEWHCFGEYTKVGDRLAEFNAGILGKFEAAPRRKALDEWRIIIPRVLFAMRQFRNARGDMHEALISPNYIDSEYIYSSMKWLLCEILRLQSDKSREEIVQIINRIETHYAPMVWDSGTTMRVLCSKLSCREQVLILLYSCQEGQTAEDLLYETEYASKSRFRNTILGELHKQRFIEYDGEKCSISPSGVVEAEKIIKNWMEKNGKK